MKQKRNKQSKKTIFSVQNVLFIAIGLLLVAVIILSLFVRQLWHYNQQRNVQYTANLILTAVDNMNWPVPTDAKTGTKYVAEANITLPSYSFGIDRLLYNYVPAIESSPAELHLVSWQSVEMQKGRVRIATTEDDFNAVPKLQSCARGVTVAFGTIKGLTPAATKKLSDGQTVYFYAEPLCPNQSLLDYAKQIESY